jgi:hypothetical protein
MQYFSHRYSYHFYIQVKINSITLNKLTYIYMECLIETDHYVLEDETQSCQSLCKYISLTTARTLK